MAMFIWKGCPRSRTRPRGKFLKTLLTLGLYPDWAKIVVDEAARTVVVWWDDGD